MTHILCGIKKGKANTDVSKIFMDMECDQYIMISNLQPTLAIDENKYCKKANNMMVFTKT